MRAATAPVSDSVPVRLTAVGKQITRISFGTRAAGAPSSYLEHIPDPAPDAGAVTVREASDPPSLVISDGAGRPRLRLLLGDALRLAPRAELRFDVLGEQHFYGLGEGGQGFDRLGTTRRLWNYQANRGQGADIAIPLLLSNAGYALFFDNAARGQIEAADVDDGSGFVYAAEPGAFDLYVITGADLREVMGGIAHLLGRATLPPRWALGYLQSTRHFETTQEVRDLAAGFRARELPCDAIIFLSTYGAARGWNRGVGHLEFEPGIFADPAALIGGLRAQNFRVFSHEYPVVHESAPGFAEAARDGHLLAHAYPRMPPTADRPVVYKDGQRMIDFTRAEARAWWWRRHHELARLGIEGWWLDGGEGPPAGEETAAGPATVLHNRYDLLRQQAFFDGETADRPQTRPYLLCRSGGPGMQRFGAVPWSGDINTTFESFETQIRTGLNLGLSGVPHWGTDIGGFYSVAPDQGELFVRWLQFGAFCSVFRGHGFVWRRHLPWAHGPEMEAICRRYIELRYRLMPLTYTLAWQARTTGLPLMRPLVLNYPADANSWDLGTQYLWGDDLLVAPVTRAGATHWTVYLPAGTWHDYWTQAVYSGPGGVTVEAPLDRLPLFVRGGALLPMTEPVQYAGPPAERITLLTYPDGTSTFTLYDDDGETTDYLRGRHALTRLSCMAEESGLTCRVEAPEGDAAVLPPGRRYVFRIRTDRDPADLRMLDGAALAAGEGEGEAGWWRDEAGFLCVALPPGPGGARISW